VGLSGQQIAKLPVLIYRKDQDLPFLASSEDEGRQCCCVCLVEYEEVCCAQPSVSLRAMRLAFAVH
jgi:hypothetical protein